MMKFNLIHKWSEHGTTQIGVNYRTDEYSYLEMAIRFPFSIKDFDEGLIYFRIRKNFPYLKRFIFDIMFHNTSKTLW